MIAIRETGLGPTILNISRGRARLRPAMLTQIERETRLLERDVKERSLTGTKGNHPFWGVTGASGDALGARSGHTRRSVVARVFSFGANVVGSVGSPLPQLRLHERGGIVTGSQYLRIPTREMQTAAGVDRLAGRSIRSLPGSFLFRSRAGNLWAAVRRGSQVVLAYLLVRSVRIRARRPFGAALARNRTGIEQRTRQLGAGLTATMNGGR